MAVSSVEVDKSRKLNMKLLPDSGKINRIMTNHYIDLPIHRKSQTKNKQFIQLGNGPWSTTPPNVYPGQPWSKDNLENQ